MRARALALLLGLALVACGPAQAEAPSAIAYLVPTATPTATPTPTPVVAISFMPAPADTGEVTAAAFDPAGGVEQWRGLVAEIFSAAQVDRVLAVMACESQGFPNVTGAAGERGLMQLAPEFYQQLGDQLFGAGADLYIPRVNLAVTRIVSSDGSDWSRWTCQP